MPGHRPSDPRAQATFGLPLDSRHSSSARRTRGRGEALVGELLHELRGQGLEVDRLELGEGPGHGEQLEVGVPLAVPLHGQHEGALAGLLSVDDHLHAHRTDRLGYDLGAFLEHLSLLAVLDEEPGPGPRLLGLLRLLDNLARLLSLRRHML